MLPTTEKGRTSRRNPVARAVKRLRPKVKRPRKGKGSYRRKGHNPIGYAPSSMAHEPAHDEHKDGTGRDR